MPTINACVVREKMPESSNSMKNRDLPNSPTTTTTTTTTPVPTTTEGKKGSKIYIFAELFRTKNFEIYC